MSIEGRLSRIKEKLAPRTTLDTGRIEEIQKTGVTKLREGDRVSVTLIGTKIETKSYINTRVTLDAEHEVRYIGKTIYPLSKTNDARFELDSELHRQLETEYRQKFTDLETNTHLSGALSEFVTDEEREHQREEATRSYELLVMKDVIVESLRKSFLDKEPALKNALDPDVRHSIFISAKIPKNT